MQMLSTIIILLLFIYLKLHGQRTWPNQSFSDIPVIITKQILIPDAQLFNKRGIPQLIVKIRAIEL